MPPSNNMGARITCSPAPQKMGGLITKDVALPLENRVLVDWLAFTFPRVLDPHHAIKIANLDSMVFEQCEYGGMGYKKSLRCGNVVVFYDGAENMGVHISMTGHGCRQYEAYAGKTNCWHVLLVRLLNHDHQSPGSTNIKRIDVAIDNVDGALDLRKLLWNLRRKRVRSLFKGGKLIEKLALHDDGKKQGKTIYLGSDSSRLKIRFYDKAAQLGLDGQWVRCEMQFMAERAHEVAKHIFRNKELGQIATAALNHYFQVINLDDSNKSRCTVQDWWASWVGNTEKLKLTTAKAIKLVDEVVDHVKRQYSSTFAMLRKYYGVVGFREIVMDLVETGKGKLSKKHEMIMACSRVVCEHELLPF